MEEFAPGVAKNLYQKNNVKDTTWSKVQAFFVSFP